MFFLCLLFSSAWEEGEKIENVVFLQMHKEEMYYPGSSKISGPTGDDFELCWLFTSKVP